MRKLLLFYALLICYVVNVYAQSRQIRGIVVEKGTNQPVIGATLTVLETKAKTATDLLGGFQIEARTGQTIQISSVGYTTTNFKITSLGNLRIEVDADTKSLNEVVVTGYSQEKKKDLTGAVTVVKVSDAVQESNTNILTSLQGRVPGLEITSDGTPGGNGTSIRIRGFSTTGNTNPLFVIDGVPTDFSGPLNPADIESIQVLKDAASASIYGSRANNGVIVITTKKGKSATPNVHFDTYFGTERVRGHVDMLSAQQWGDVYWQAQRNAGTVPGNPVYGNGANPVIPAFIDAAHTEPSSNTDWQRVITRPSFTQSYNLSLDQSTGKSSVFANFNYAGENGIERYTGYNRFSTRVNTSYNVSKVFQFGENLQVANFRQVAANALYDAILQMPIVPVYATNGNFGGVQDGLGDKGNPLRELYNNKDNNSKNWRIFGNAYALLNPIDGLSIKSSIGVDYSSYNMRAFTPSYTEGRFIVADNFLNTTNNNSLNWTWSNTAEYKKTFGKHNLDVLLGVEAIKYHYEAFNGQRQDFLLNDYNYAYLGAGSTTNEIANGSGTEWALLSQFAKLNYNFEEKYLFSATVRRDGSSRFSKQNQYGVFPAFSAGWAINEESFLKDVKQIDQLKLRASWGQTGNQQIGDFGTQDLYTSNADYGGYDFAGAGTSINQGYYINTIGNNLLKWETNTQSNIGIDLSMFNNQFSATADYYIKTTNGMLLNPTLLADYGVGAVPYINAGKMQNKGFELILDYKNSSDHAFKYDVAVNFATNSNKVLSLGASPYFLGSAADRVIPGQPVGEFYGYVADGLFRTASDVTNSAAQTGKGLGRIRYKDLDGSGTIDPNDRTNIGNPNPKFLYGLNFNSSYKGFDMSLFFSGVYGNKIYNTIKQLTDFAYFPFNFGKNTLNAWSPTNTGSNIPALSTSNLNDELRNSTYFVESGSYLKLKSVVLGYTIPLDWIKKIGVKKLRVYFQGENLLVFTKYSGLDPEIGTGNAFNLGIDSELYPHSRGYNLGLNVTF